MTELYDDNEVTEKNLEKFPKIVQEVFEECATTWKCGECGASRRGSTFHDASWGEAELIVVIECRSCGTSQTRYYGSG